MPAAVYHGLVPGMRDGRRGRYWQGPLAEGPEGLADDACGRGQVIRAVQRSNETVDRSCLGGPRGNERRNAVKALTFLTDTLTCKVRRARRGLPR